MLIPFLVSELQSGNSMHTHSRITNNKQLVLTMQTDIPIWSSLWHIQYTYSLFSRASILWSLWTNIFFFCCMTIGCLQPLPHNSNTSNSPTVRYTGWWQVAWEC